MRYWYFWIGDEPVLGSGWARAESVEDVRSSVPHPDITFTEIPDDSGFPGPGQLLWDHKAPELLQ